MTEKKGLARKGPTAFEASLLFSTMVAARAEDATLSLLKGCSFVQVKAISNTGVDPELEPFH